jgi:hypothetical protein
MIACTLVLCAGCSGGGSTGSSVSDGGGSGGGGVQPVAPVSMLSSVSGIVSDGPIANARVCLDLNRNGKYDEAEGEPFSITNKKGEYWIEYILDPGIEYMIVVEGNSTTLHTYDVAGDIAGELDFTLFFSMTATGGRGSVPSAAAYVLDANPVTFRNYLTTLQGRIGEINDPNIKNFIKDPSDNAGMLFTTYIKDQAGISVLAAQAAHYIGAEDSRQDLAAVQAGLDISAGAVLDFADGSTFQELTGSLMYQNASLSVIGDVVVATLLNDATVNDVVLTNMNSAEITDILTFTIQPGLLAAYDVSVTPYKSVLEITKFEELRAAGDEVVLGGDITAKDAGGAKKTDQLVSCTAVSTPAAFMAGLRYYYFDGTNWIDGGAVTASMNIGTVPFVIVKPAAASDKSLTIEGLTQLQAPTVIIKGYMPSDSQKTEMTIDAFLAPAGTDTVGVKVPEDFIISEIIIVDSELAKVNQTDIPSLTIPVNDTLLTTVLSASLSDGGTDMIVDPVLCSALKQGSHDQDFPGIGAYIDTKVIHRGVEPFLGTSIEKAVADLINLNFENYLTKDSPVFNSGSGSYPGVTINSQTNTIEVLLAEADASIDMRWTFSKNSIVRVYSKKYVSGTYSGSVYDSTYTYMNASQNITNVLLEETVSQYENTFNTINASYEGAAVYNRADGSVKSAKFYQKVSETNIVTNKTDMVNGMVAMAGSGLSFDGTYSCHLRSYETVKGTVNIEGATHAKGLSLENTYFNYNNVTNASAVFSASETYTIPAANPAWLTGVWTGAFTDSCDTAKNDGEINLVVTGTNATWWGQSDDMARNYGTAVSIADPRIRLMDGESLWSEGVKISDTRIEGIWSFNGCSGTYYLNKN